MKTKIKGLTYLLLLSTSILSGSVFASEVYGHAKKHADQYHYKGEAYKSLEPAQTRGHFEILGAPGIAKLSAGNSPLSVTPSETDQLVQTNSNSWNTIAGQLGVGYVYYTRNAQQYSDHVQWFPSLEPELNVYQLTSHSINGNVYSFGIPGYNDLTFDIPVYSTRLMLDLALTVASWKRLSLYGIGGFGEAWTRLGYQDNNSNAGSNPSCPDQLRLNSNNNSNVVWEAGAGLIYAINNRFGVSFEYLYTNLGTVSTSSNGNIGGFAVPILTPARFNLRSQTGLVGLHIAL